MISFKDAFEKTLIFEGGGKYTNDPIDPGGKTRWGITERVARENGYKGDMKNFPLYLAEQIALKNYWEPLNLSKINSQEIANKLFDIAFSKGLKIAGMIFQKVINSLMDGDEKLIVDGIIGEKTLLEFKKLKHKKAILNLIKYFEIKRILEIIEKNDKLNKYLNGWLNRV